MVEPAPNWFCSLISPRIDVESVEVLIFRCPLPAFVDLVDFGIVVEGVWDPIDEDAVSIMGLDKPKCIFNEGWPKTCCTTRSCGCNIIDCVELIVKRR